MNLHWSKYGHEKQNYLKVMFMVTTVNNLFIIGRFTINIKKKLD